MTIWIIFAAMTGLAVMAALLPLSRRKHAEAASAAEGERLFYEDQLAEVERDHARGLISAEEMRAAKAEAARRLIRATAQERGPQDTVDEPALRRRRAASAIALSSVPLLALAVYGAYGSPQLPAQPLSARLEETIDPRNLDITEAVARIEAHLAQDTDDGRGLERARPGLHAPGPLPRTAARGAFANARWPASAGRIPPRLASISARPLESQTPSRACSRASGGGDVSHRAIALDAKSNPRPRFYRGTTRPAEQDGDRVAAAARRLEEIAPPLAGRNAPLDGPRQRAPRRGRGGAARGRPVAPFASAPPARRRATAASRPCPRPIALRRSAAWWTRPRDAVEGGRRYGRRNGCACCAHTL